MPDPIAITTTYGDISPRTAAHAAVELLKRAQPLLILEKFAQPKTIPAKSSTSVKFRRYNALDPTPNALSEGVTPTGKKLTVTDIPAALLQYGDWVELTDIIMDHHEDPVLKEAMGVLGEQAAQMIETVRFNCIKAGAGVTLANGDARTAINSTLTLTLQRKATRALKRQNARAFTSVIRSTPSFGTVNVPPSFVGVAHPDCETVIRSLTGFKSVEDYGSYESAYEGEIGKVEDVRYITSTVFKPWTGAGANAVVTDGGTPATTLRTMIGTAVESVLKCDVYPVIYMARDAWADVPFKGSNAVRPMVLNPNTPRGGDPLGQRGSVSWKASHVAKILNDAWMHRVEIAVEEL